MQKLWFVNMIINSIYCFQLFFNHLLSKCKSYILSKICYANCNLKCIKGIIPPQDVKNQVIVVKIDFSKSI